jgi:hypothetical protein
MEILELTPCELGVDSAGVYVVDDDGQHVLAGPFASEIAALIWINLTHEARVRSSTITKDRKG